MSLRQLRDIGEERLADQLRIARAFRTFWKDISYLGVDMDAAATIWREAGASSASGEPNWLPEASFGDEAMKILGQASSRGHLPETIACSCCGARREIFSDFDFNDGTMQALAAMMGAEK